MTITNLILRESRSGVGTRRSSVSAELESSLGSRISTDSTGCAGCRRVDSNNGFMGRAHVETGFYSSTVVPHTFVPSSFHSKGTRGCTSERFGASIPATEKRIEVPTQCSSRTSYQNLPGIRHHCCTAFLELTT